MKFINDINEQYLEKIEKEAIKRRIDKTKEDIRTMLLFSIVGIILLIGACLWRFWFLF